MTNFPIAGASVRVSYGWEETAFGTESASINKAFSQGVKLTAFDIDNSVEYVYGVGSQDAQKSVCKEFKGSYGIEFVLSDGWWLKGILGESPAKTGSGPYTYTYDSTSGLSNTQSSFSMDLGFDLDTDSHQVLLGCVMNSMNLTCNVGDTVKVRLEGPFSNLAKDTTLESLVSPVEEPFTFAQGSFELPNSTTVGDVQNVEMSFNRNNEFIWGLGSRHAQNKVAKAREWNIKLTATYEADSQFLDHVLGSTTAPVAAPAEVATARITLTNGLSTTSLRSYTFTFANVRVERIGIPASVEDTIKQEVTLRARTLTSVIMINNTSAEL